MSTTKDPIKRPNKPPRSSERSDHHDMRPERYANHSAQRGGAQRERVQRDDSRLDLKLSEVWERGMSYAYETHKSIRKQRKIDARLRLLEFCLRPHLALLLYTFGASFIGRGLTHFITSPPYSSVWWNEGVMWPIAIIGWGEWDTYSSSKAVEYALDYAEWTMGVVFIAVGLFTLYAPRMLSQSLTRYHKRNQAASSKTRLLEASHQAPNSVSSSQKSRAHSEQLIQDQLAAQMHESAQNRLTDPPRGAQVAFMLCLLGCGLQLFYAISAWLNKQAEFATFLEHSLQVSIPLGCALMLPNVHPRFESLAERIIRLGLSLTFAGHGLYALNIAPTPSNFITMTLNLTSFGESGAHFFLGIIGALDLVAALLLWIPIREFRRVALLYMILWGALTALARPLGMPSFDWLERIFVWGPEMLWRTSHALIPLWLWLRTQRA